MSPLLDSLCIRQPYNCYRPPFNFLPSSYFYHQPPKEETTPNKSQKWPRQRHRRRLISPRSTKLSFTISLEQSPPRLWSSIRRNLAPEMCLFACELLHTRSSPWRMLAHRIFRTHSGVCHSDMGVMENTWRGRKKVLLSEGTVGN